MSITAYVGLPRHGKTYGVVEHVILPALRAGRRVATNVPLYPEVIRRDVQTGELQLLPTDEVAKAPDRIFEYATPGTVLVLDEVWKFFPAGLRANKVPDAYKKLLAEHGHMVDERGDSMQIVLVTQDLSQISAFARELVEHTYAVNKLSVLGFGRKYRVDVYSRGQMGKSLTPSKRIREMYGRYRPEVWKYYKSHTMSEAGADGANEQSVDRRFVVWKSPLFFVGAPLCLLVLVGCVVGLYRKFNPEPEPVVQTARPSVPSGREGDFATSGGSSSALTRRVAGVIRMPLEASGGWALLEDADFSVRVPLRGVCSERPVGEWVCEFRGKEFSSFVRARKPDLRAGGIFGLGGSTPSAAAPPSAADPL
jgi:hypothetical protein